MDLKRYADYFGFDFAKWPHPLAVWDEAKSEPFVFKEKFSTKETNKRGVDGIRRLIGRLDTSPIVKAAGSSNFPFMVQTFDNQDSPFVSSLLDDKWKNHSAERLLIDLFTGVTKSGGVINNEADTIIFLTVPVSFNRTQMKKIETTFMDAGLRAPMFISQPEAVALLYAHHSNEASSSVHKLSKNVLIFNMDCAYSDVAVVTISSEKCEVKAMTGSAVGGIELTSNIMSHILPNYKNVCKKYLDGKKNYSAVKNLGDEAQKLIRQLSKKEEYTVDINLTAELKTHKVVTRREFEMANIDVFQEIERLIKQCLEDSYVENIDNVVIVGVCSEIPKLQTIITETCKAKELRIGINRLEAAVCGAVVAGAIHANRIKMDFVPVTSRSIGIKIHDDSIYTIIYRNTSLPSESDAWFSTFHAYQPEALVLVYEQDGDVDGRKVKNNFLGFLKITGIPKYKRGTPLIKVSMKVDSLSCLTVKASLIVPGSFHVVMAIESRMPQAEHGFGSLPEELKRRYGSTMDLSTI